MKLFLAGRMAAVAKEAICRSTLWQIRREMAKPGSAFWMKGGRRAEHPALTTRP